MSYLESLTRRGAPSLLGSVHADKNAVVLKGLASAGGDLEVDAIVGRLRGGATDNGRVLAQVERCEVRIEQQLVEGLLVLDERLQVEVKRYPGADFAVAVEESDVGGPLVKLTLTRKPITSFDPRRKGAR